MARLRIGKEKRRRVCDHCFRRQTCQYVPVHKRWYCSAAIGEMMAQEKEQA